MTTQPRLFVHRRSDGVPAEILGEARLILPQLVQVLPPLDDTLSTVAHHAADLIVVPDGFPHKAITVSRLRPAAISFVEAEQLAVRNGAVDFFTPTARFMVALELSQPYATDPAQQETPSHPRPPHDPDCPHAHPHPGPCRVGEPWWCKVFCLSGSCANC